MSAALNYLKNNSNNGRMVVNDVLFLFFMTLGLEIFAIMVISAFVLFAVLIMLLINELVGLYGGR